jgi:antitoxin ParD1/3/4
MTELTIQMAEPLSHYVKAQLATGDYADESAYFNDLVRRDQAMAELRNMLKEAEESGIGEKSFDELIAQARAEAHATNG